LRVTVPGTGGSLMSKQVRYRCRVCSLFFERREYDGMFPYILHCEKCDKDVPVEMDSEELVTRDHAVVVANVEKRAQPCECGGQPRFALPARCPGCGSDDCEKP
jgi:hypothetical protein